MVEEDLELILVQRCVKHDNIAQRQLYEQYAYAMMVTCCRYISNRHDAEEALADAFCSFYRNLHQFSYAGKGSVQAWLKKIVINQCLTYLRKRKMSFSNWDDIPEQVSVNEEISGLLTAKEIMKHIQQLPDGYRTVFNLYLFEGMSHKEIGEMLGITESTSKSQLHKAKSRLQTAILKDK